MVAKNNVLLSLLKQNYNRKGGGSDFSDWQCKTEAKMASCMMSIRDYLDRSILIESWCKNNKKQNKLYLIQSFVKGKKKNYIIYIYIYIYI